MTPRTQTNGTHRSLTHDRSYSAVLIIAMFMVSACTQETADTSTRQSGTTPAVAEQPAPTEKQPAKTGLAFKPDTLDMPGRPVWEANCQVCHGTGLAGAPVIGNQKSWEKRVARGTPSLYEHALNGWGDMPARGGNPALTDEQVTLAVNFMVAQVEPSP